MRHLNKTTALLSLAFFLIIFSCKTEKEETTKKTKKVPLVEVEPAQKTKMFSFIDITGTIEANLFTHIKSPADGIIELLTARENQQVEKDKIIAVINPNDRVSLISNNQLQIQEIEAKLKSSDKNSNEYDTLLKELEIAKRNLEYAKKMYQNIPVVCPMKGVVTQRYLDIGSQVSSGEKILTISDMNSLVIKAEVNEKYFEAIKQGKKVPVILNAYPNDTVKGNISIVYPQVNPITRSVKFDIKILNFKKKILPGMMASIKIPVTEKLNTIAVPEHSVLNSPDNKKFLFIVEDNMVFRRTVKTGIVMEQKIEIIEGLNEKESVVIMGQEMLKDSMQVKILKK